MFQRYRITFMAAPMLAALALAACSPDAGQSTEKSEGGVDHWGLADKAVKSSSRPDADKADDAARKPAQVLAFTGVEPGMKVFEMEAGGGYYTELLSPIVGESGEVVMQNPKFFDNFLSEAFAERLADNRLPNVRHARGNFDQLDAEDGSMDIVTWFLGPHELYFTPAGIDTLGDVEGTYAEVMRILKPGGVFVVLDHAAAPGSPESTGDTLHRIDPAIVKGLAEAAGFILIAESDVLRNPDDMFDMGVFDPAVRRRTDRFLLKYKKPA